MADCCTPHRYEIWPSTRPCEPQQDDGADELARRVAKLEEGIRHHRTSVWITSEADYRLYALLEDDDV